VSNSGGGFNSSRGRERSDPFYGSGFKCPVSLCELWESAVFEPIEATEMRFSRSRSHSQLEARISHSGECPHRLRRLLHKVEMLAAMERETRGKWGKTPDVVNGYQFDELDKFDD